MKSIKSMAIHGQLNAMAVGIFLPLLGFSLVNGSTTWAVFDTFAIMINAFAWWHASTRQTEEI